MGPVPKTPPVRGELTGGVEAEKKGRVRIWARGAILAGLLLVVVVGFVYGNEGVVDFRMGDI